MVNRRQEGINEGVSLADFVAEHETAADRAFEHALDIELEIIDWADYLGITKAQLAERMGISRSQLSNLLNTQPNMTLETISKFELALGLYCDFHFRPVQEYQYSYLIEDYSASLPVANFFDGAFQEQSMHTAETSFCGVIESKQLTGKGVAA